jgi:hypothetical protein
MKLLAFILVTPSSLAVAGTRATANREGLQMLGRWLKERMASKKERHMKRLFAALANDPDTYKAIKDLAKATDLHQVVYPLLADLTRQGLVEYEWLEAYDRRKLAYRLTPCGRIHCGFDHDGSRQEH